MILTAANVTAWLENTCAHECANLTCTPRLDIADMHLFTGTKSPTLKMTRAMMMKKRMRKLRQRMRKMLKKVSLYITANDHDACATSAVSSARL